VAVAAEDEIQVAEIKALRTEVCDGLGIGVIWSHLRRERASGDFGDERRDARFHSRLCGRHIHQAAGHVGEGDDGELRSENVGRSVAVEGLPQMRFDVGEMAAGAVGERLVHFAVVVAKDGVDGAGQQAEQQHEHDERI
jgi:hypothetical protein